MNISQYIEKYQIARSSAKDALLQGRERLVKCAIEYGTEIKWVLLIMSVGTVAVIVTITQWPHANSQPEVLGVSTSSATPSAQPKASPDSTIKVDVSGAVNHPGIVVLKNGDRIDDALRAAGGYNDHADTQYLAAALNLAQRLNDGDKLYIPDKDNHLATNQMSPSNSMTPNSTPLVYQPAGNTPTALVQPSTGTGISTTTPTPPTSIKSGPTPTKTPTPTSSAPVSINNASQSDLEALPGIGPSYAQKIISHRPYTSLDQVCVTGILGTGSLCQKITPLITL